MSVVWWAVETIRFASSTGPICSGASRWPGNALSTAVIYYSRGVRVEVDPFIPLEPLGRRVHRYRGLHLSGRPSGRPLSLCGQAQKQCPLWVISGHGGLHERMSALPLKADILRGG